MKFVANIVKIIFSIGFVLCISGCTISTLKHADYVIENVHVVPMNEEIILSNQSVAIRDKKIVGIFSANEKKWRADIRIDGQGRFLMPGLADMHIHLRMNPQVMFNLFIANGVTTIRNMRLADGDVNHVELRAKVESGSMVGPRYIVSGPMITPKNLAAVSEVVPMLERHITESYDFVKIHEDLEPAVYDALIREADARGLTVTGHAQHGLPLSESLRMSSIEHMEEFLYVSRQGLGKTASIEEFLARYKMNLEQLADPDFRAAVVKDVRESGITIAPSLVIYDYLHRYLSNTKFEQLQLDPNLRYLPTSTREQYASDSNPYRNELPQVFASVLEEETIDEHFQKNVALLSQLVVEMHEAGVNIISGADAFGLVVPGFSLHQELALMVAAGLTPYEALKTSTVNVASYLGEGTDSGRIAIGSAADFILVDGNPLADIRNASRVSGVFTHGMWHDKDALTRMLSDVEKFGLAESSL